MSPKQAYQIKDSPFYNLNSKRKLAELLRISSDTMTDLSSGRKMYTRRWKHKKLKQWINHAPPEILAEKYRPIDIPEPKLKAVQSRIAALLSRIQTPDFLFSPVKGRSYVENAAHHIDSNAFHLLDVADYFPSCTANNIAHFFHQDMKCSRDVTAILVKLTTLNECLPQGSPCSPILAYYCNRPMWLAIEACVKTAGCKLSLYADDITISGKIVPKKIIWEIKRIIHKNGLQLKLSKEVSLIHSPADITGVIVKSGKTFLPNRQHKKLSELRKEFDKTKDTKERTSIQSRINGRISQRYQVEKTKNSDR